MLRRFEVGEKFSEIAKVLGFVVFIVVIIRDNKEKIKASLRVVIFLRVFRLIRYRSVVMEIMERLLYVWFED